jgi:opacity protein-like surface antigen
VKFLVLIGVLFCFPGFAQTQSVQSAPISVSADGLAGEAGEDEDTMRARAELAQSRLKSSDDEAPAQYVEPEASAEQAESSVPTKAKAKSKDKRAKKRTTREPMRLALGERYMLVRGGYLASSWKKIDSELSGGTRLFGLGFYQRLHSKIGYSGALEFAYPTQGSLVPEEVRMTGVRFEADYAHGLSEHVFALGSFGVNFTDYNIRKKIESSDTRETYQLFGDGQALGVDPGLGFRTFFTKDVFVDLKFNYRLYFSSPARNFGGPELLLSLLFKL